MPSEPAAGMRVAIVGCGRMGEKRRDAARALGAEVIAVYDPVPEASRRLSDAAARVLGAWHELPFDQLDAVFVCTPPVDRGSVERACVEAGVPFFVEKPIGLNADGGAALVALMGSAPVVTAVGYMNRYRRSVREVREALRNEALIGWTALWAGGVYRRDWWLDSTRSGGPVNEQATHFVDLARYLGGEIVEVVAVPSTDPSAGPTTSCSITLRFQSGVLGTFLYSCEAEAKSIAVRAVTAQRSFLLDTWELISPSSPPDEDVFLVETAAFLSDARNGGDEVLSDLADAVRTQRVVDAIHASLASGRRAAVG